MSVNFGDSFVSSNGWEVTVTCWLNSGADVEVAGMSEGTVAAVGTGARALQAQMSNKARPLKKSLYTQFGFIYFSIANKRVNPPLSSKQL